MTRRRSTRRKLLIVLGLGALSVTLPSGAQQQGKVWRIGILLQPARADALTGARFRAFVDGMRDLGYVEGKNIVFEWRFADGRVDRLPALAAELVKLEVDVIVTSGTPCVSAARQVTTTIPIVAASFGNPIAGGFAASLSRPGGNVTGLTTMGEVIYAKRLEMLTTVAPKVTRVAFLVNLDNTFFSRAMPAFQAAAQKAGTELVVVNARNASEFEDAFSLISRQRAGALMVGADAVLNSYDSRIAELAVRHRLPSIFANARSVEAGGLMSYGADVAARFRSAATFVDRIFKGAKPGDLPIEQPTQFELVINLKTAKALGITIPQTMLIRADRVIE